jgi:hypothetical protein
VGVKVNGIPTIIGIVTVVGLRIVDGADVARGLSEDDGPKVESGLSDGGWEKNDSPGTVSMVPLLVVSFLVVMSYSVKLIGGGAMGAADIITLAVGVTGKNSMTGAFTGTAAGGVIGVLIGSDITAIGAGV